MNIRTLTGADKEAQERLYSLSYVYPYFPSETPPDAAAQLKGNLGAFEDGELAAAVITHDFTCVFNGQRARLGGIGGVACRPESKRRGYAKALLDKSLEMMYKDGYVFSALYPFSNVFYRRLGYEFAFSHRRCFVERDTLTQFPVRGSFTAVNDANEHIVYELYERFSANLDFSLVRDEKLWQNFKKDGFNSMDYRYLYFSESGEPEGYLLAQNVSQDGNTFSVKDFAYLSGTALRSILGFIGSFNNHKNVVFDEAGHMNMLRLLAEPYDVKLEMSKRGMLRVVNVLSALSLLTAPQTDGSVVIGVMDEKLPQNNGAYELNCSQGRLAVSKTEKAPELTFTIPALSAAFSGLTDFDTLAMTSEGIVGATSNPLLRLLFPQRETNMNDHF